MKSLHVGQWFRRAEIKSADSVAGISKFNLIGLLLNDCVAWGNLFNLLVLQVSQSTSEVLVPTLGRCSED